MKKFDAKVAHYSAMPAKIFGPDAPGTSIRVLVSDLQDGAPVYNMRMIEVEAGGSTPLHAHPYEHENYVLEGRGQVLINEQLYPIEPGVVILVPPSAIHQYRNTGDTLLRFLCSVPVESLRPVAQKDGVRQTNPPANKK